MPAPEFRRQVDHLRNHGWTTLTMARFLKILEGRERAPAKSVLLTFDDGFRDNFTQAFPILREAGAHATLFLATGLIRPDDQPGREPPRPFTEAHAAARRGDFGDFVSHAELATMTASGVMEIHAHGHDHGQVFIDTLVEGVYPRTTDHWGVLSAYRHPLSGGLWPVFPRVPALVAPALWPRAERLAEFSRYLEPGTRVPEDLFHRETVEEATRRVEQDLRISLELTAPYRPAKGAVVCWPWGRTTPALEAVAMGLGYRLAFRTDTGANVPGSGQFGVYRFPVRKAGLFRFALGLFLRRRPVLARWYGLWRGLS